MFFGLLESLLQVALAFEAVVAETFCLIMAAKLDVHQSPLLYGYAEPPRTLPNNFTHFYTICENLQSRDISNIVWYVKLADSD